MKRNLEIEQSTSTQQNEEEKAPKKNKQKKLSKKVVENSFERIIFRRDGCYYLELKVLEEEEVRCFRFFKESQLVGCLKLHENAKKEGSISILYGAKDMNENKDCFSIFIGMIKAYLYEKTEVVCLEINISSEDFRGDVDKRFNNSFNVPICPPEWKGKGQWTSCRALMKEYGFINDLPFFFPKTLEIDKNYVFCC